MTKLLLQFVGVALFTGIGWGQVTQRVNVASNGEEAEDECLDPAISADGRFVAFFSNADNLVPGHTSGLFVRDRQTGATEFIAVQGHNPAFSADGRYLAFASYDNTLVPDDTNNVRDVFVIDRQTGVIERVSLAQDDVQANNESLSPAISADGRFVAFESRATNLFPGDVNNSPDIFLRDRQAGTTGMLSVATAGTLGNNDSVGPAISADGRYVAFTSIAVNLTLDDTNGLQDVFVRDRATSTTERVSLAWNGAQGNHHSGFAGISDDGLSVAFASDATNLVPTDTSSQRDIFVRDLTNGTTVRISVGPGGVQANSGSANPSISGDGRYVSFLSFASNLVPGDVPMYQDVYVHDRLTGTNVKVSVDSVGDHANFHSYEQSLSSNGGFVAFTSEATNLVVGDANSRTDFFVRQLEGGTSFTSVCSPGVDRVIGCPCGNPPSGVGRGCDNSSATGGAVLSAIGGAYLSSDSLVFTATDEKPTALSIVSQWTGPNATGVILGMGVRCTSGSLKRLYTKSAVGGSITAPDFGAGDLQVSVRSASLGNAILAGQSRWYYVYYRDPIVLGGCPAISTFNATQTGAVTWSP